MRANYQNFGKSERFKIKNEQLKKQKYLRSKLQNLGPWQRKIQPLMEVQLNSCMIKGPGLEKH